MKFEKEKIEARLSVFMDFIGWDREACRRQASVIDCLENWPHHIVSFDIEDPKRLSIHVASDEPVKGECLYFAEREICRTLEIDSCSIYPKFSAEAKTQENFLCGLLPWAARSMEEADFALFSAFLPTLKCFSDEERILIRIPSKLSKVFTSETLGLLKDFYSERIDTDVDILVQNGKNNVSREKFLQARNSKFEALAQKAAEENAAEEQGALEKPVRVLNEHGEPELVGAAAKPQPKHRGSNKKDQNYYRRSKPKDMIWGRTDTRLGLTEINHLDSESGRVRVYGSIHKYESRLVSNNTRSLVKFAIYGVKGAISCFLFLRDPADEPGLREQIPDGCYVYADLDVSYDGCYNKDLQGKVIGLRKAEAPPERIDYYPDKRVELHLHTNMSAQDGVSRPSEAVRLADHFGMPAVAITDHGVVQAFPEACDTLDKLREQGSKMKIIYGCEIYLVDDGDECAYGFGSLPVGDRYVALDLETTGLDPAEDRIIEIGAVRFCKDESGHYFPEERYETLVDPEMPLPEKITEITGIRNEDLKDAKNAAEALKELHDFIGQDPICAHNAFFDLGFLRAQAYRTPHYEDPKLKFNPVVIDTLQMARHFLPGLEKYNLAAVAKKLNVPLEQHHRAADDAVCSGFIFDKLWAKEDYVSLRELNARCGQLPLSEITRVKNRPYHCIVLVKDLLGLYNLYRLVSEAHVRYFKKRPRVPRSLLKYLRHGLIIGSACEAGEIFRGITKLYAEAKGQYDKALELVLNDPDLKRRAQFYDYLEIQPIGNNRFMLEKENNYIDTEEDLQNLNRLVKALADRYGKDTVATCDSHFLNEEDAVYRQILQSAIGFDVSSENVTNLYFRNTEEMLREFSYFPEAEARKMVIENTQKIAAMVNPDLRPFPKGTFPPEIKSAADDVRNMTWDSCRRLYEKEGVIPDNIVKRVEKELSSIIDNGFGIMYYIAHMLVKKTNEDGYIVGSRGSVGSSVVAYLCGISEVNPLPPHYVCPNCHYSEFAPDGEFGSGFDMPPKKCPECGSELKRDGQDIPFETFLGFNGDKQPDIDLNFSGEYQATAHRFIEEMFGESHTYRAGTITGYAEKNARILVLKYMEAAGIYLTKADVDRHADGLIGIKRSTGQHPGGIVVIPKDREVYDFTPIQFPADKLDAVMNTTHFDFNAMHDTILKLDILGHDDPTMLKVMSDFTGVKIEDIPIPDPKVMALFQSTEPLGIEPGTSPADCGSLGLPEMGTRMAREMIRETKPTQFFDLVQLMGLSHGTDVWSGNAQDLIRSGTCTINEVIGCRDGIMTSLINWGLPSKASFDIMEKVRKGRGLTPEREALMRENHVPEWYIESCKKIKYMFPKAHAAAYVISSLRVAYFKVYYPEAYYAAYFSVRADEFDYTVMCQSHEKVTAMREDLGRRFHEITDREQKIFYILELVEEMYLRGIRFAPMDIEKSEARRFLIPEKGLILPALNTMPSISTAMAYAIVKARKDGPFKNHEELRSRAGLGPSSIETLAENHVLDHIPASAQISLFDMMH